MFFSFKKIMEQFSQVLIRSMTLTDLACKKLCYYLAYTDTWLWFRYIPFPPDMVVDIQK